MIQKVIYHIDKIENAFKDKIVTPISCEIDPSNTCMLDCSFCLYKGKEKLKPFLDYNLYLKLLRDLKKIGCLSITFTGGGEPLIHPKFNTMVKDALDFGFEIGLVTNGILLDSVEDLDKFKFVRVSLNAGTPEVYEKITGKNLFNKAISSVKNAVKRNGETTIGLSFVVCNDNEKDIANAKTIAENLGVDYIQFKPVVSKSVSTLEETYPDNISIWTNRYKSIDDRPCKIAGLIGIVGSSGNVYYCCQGRGNPDFLLGNIEDASFKAIWGKRIDKKIDISKCYACRYMNYVKQYDELVNIDKFIGHRNFL